MAIGDTFRKAARQRFENAVYGVMNKFGYASGGAGQGIMGAQSPSPPYERQIPAQWIYRIRRNQSLINNAVEEKVHQTFRRGFTEWEKEYIAKCPVCRTEFENVEPFREQLGEDGDELTAETIDFNTPRPCPNDECVSCKNDELVTMETPDSKEKEKGDMMFEQVNERGHNDRFLDGQDQNSVGQTFLEVCQEVALDVQSFDDGWMIFQRTYITNDNGEVLDWELEEVHRGAPELFRYDVNEEEGRIGGNKYVCIECRATKDNYSPQNEATSCENCGNRVYPAYAYRLNEPRGRPDEYFIRGEFAHGSEYQPSKLYGYSPILSLWEEGRTLEQMDGWYKEAYEERRAPRGAMVVRSSNAESTRSWNQQQMNALREDPQHIPTFIDDTEGQGQPLQWVDLLSEPAQMQHMQMREWFLDRISAKYGVTAVFQSASPQNSGLSQSMEIIVSNRSAQKLKRVFETVFIPAFLSQLQVEGWTRSISRIEEEDEQAEAQRVGSELQNAQVAIDLGAEVEWTEEDRADIKSGELAGPDDGGDEEEGGGMMGMGGGEEEGDDDGPDMFNEDGEPDPGGQTTPTGGRPYEPNQRSGEPRNPREPSTDDPIAHNDSGGGSHNAAYGGAPSGEALDFMESLRDQLEEQNSNDEKLLEQADYLHDINFSGLGLDADTIKEYAESDSKEFRDLREDHYGKWVKSPNAEQSAIKLYEMYS